MASDLDNEIEQLRERAARLTKQLQVQTSTLLSSELTRRLLQDSTAHDGLDAATRKRLLGLCDKHAAHRQQCLYRAGASATTFRVQDPDPNAVDGGRVLGVRVDVMMGSQFLRPYYVLLHRDDSTQSRRAAIATKAKAGLRVHRHTVPPCIPLSGLATRHLLSPGTDGPDLYGFVRALRRALVRYHNRLAVIGDMRRAIQVPKTGTATDNDADIPLVDVSGADAEAKQIKLDWADGRTGRLVLDDDGDIQQLVVIGATGSRDRVAARALLGEETTASGLVRKLSKAS